MNAKEQLYHKWVSSNLIHDEKLLNAFMKIKREHFIDAEYLDHCYADKPLPIGMQQTISQPTTVMIMLQLLELNKEDKLLEIGTGSGYNVAIAASIVKKAYSVERITQLVHLSRANLKLATIDNVEVIDSDGKKGYLPASPYSKIIVTAAAEEIPAVLLDQLSANGILVSPVGLPGNCTMVKIYKDCYQQIHKTTHGFFSFVPLR
ncbi:MAG: protein-L-isoaspartate(D-aspartate) O-methyltransferase [Endozoicomonadaceae bacterium]|nr:protein-L-isoaspartate(D-aspartate) O-methyltransferase [Endozoicomonadaceae bacterium]